MLTSEEKKFLLALARRAITEFFDTGKPVGGSVGAKGPSSLQLPNQQYGHLPKPGACFVTLKKDIVELRGCVGSLEAAKPLYQNVIDNAIRAAFEDSRFFPLTKEELPDIAIEISVLTKPEPLKVGAISNTPLHETTTDILNALTVGVDGVIIRRGNKSATYLPQVWDEMLEKHNFLSSLCLKAGLEPDDWQKPGTEIETYRVEHFSE